MNEHILCRANINLSLSRNMMLEHFSAIRKKLRRNEVLRGLYLFDHSIESIDRFQ